MNEWQRIDESNGLLMPWYTHPFLDELQTWDVSKWNVFEYGAGMSTLWWRNKANHVESVDSSLEWSKTVRAIYSPHYDNFIESIRFHDKYKELDCVIIDCEPNEWRDNCTEMALNGLKKGGILIIDNYEQPSVEPNVWTKTNELLKNYECKIFKQPNHADWKTAYWIIK